MEKIKHDDVSVKELKATLGDISNYALLQIIRERVKLNEVSLHDIADVARDHPEAVCIKVWQKDDIREYRGGDKLTEQQIDYASRIAAKGLEECTDYEWACIDVAVSEASKN